MWIFFFKNLGHFKLSKEILKSRKLRTPGISLATCSISIWKKSPWSVLSKRSSRNFAEFTGKHLCHIVPFLIKLQASACNFIKNETPAQALSCEFCGNLQEDLFLNTYSGCFLVSFFNGCTFRNVGAFSNQNVTAWEYWKLRGFISYRHWCLTFTSMQAQQPLAENVATG